MARKPKNDSVSHLPAVVEAAVPAITLDALQGFAAWLGVDLAAGREERGDMAAAHMNRSQRHLVAAGTLLLSLKAECAHGEFTKMLDERGFAPRAAQRAMQYSAFVVSRPEVERERLLAMPQGKVLALASADHEVVEVILAGDAGDIDLLTVKQLNAKLADMEAATADLTVQRDTFEAEAEGLRKKLKRGLPDRADQVPHVIADLRAEIVALGRKADLALDSFTPLGAQLADLHGAGDGVHEWSDATTRLAVSQLAVIRMQADGLLAKFVKLLPGEDPTPAPRSKLTKQEVSDAAKAWSALAQTHTYEAELREWQRQQGRPKGKGRPAAKPVAPGGAE